MGYHYPFENYISLFRNCCTKDTIFIFDIASGQYEVSFFKKYFDSTEVIYSEETIHPLKRLCCKMLKYKHLYFAYLKKNSSNDLY